MNSSLLAILCLATLVSLAAARAQPPSLFGAGLSYGQSSGGYQQSGGSQYGAGYGGGYNSGYGAGYGGGVGYPIGGGGYGGGYGAGYQSGYSQGSGYQQASGGYSNSNIGLGFGVGRRR